jgi:hypothetical protein
MINFLTTLDDIIAEKEKDYSVSWSSANTTGDSSLVSNYSSGTSSIYTNSTSGIDISVAGVTSSSTTISTGTYTVNPYGVGSDSIKEQVKELLKDFVKWAKEKKSEVDLFDVGLTIGKISEGKEN